MNPTPFFTVLVPVYNHAAYVGAALDSLLAQTDTDWEAVVVNDGSTDNTADVLESYRLRDERVRVFTQPNGGVASALNHGLREAHGHWVCWLSSDDLFEPTKLAAHRAWCERYPGESFFFTRHRTLDNATGVVADAPLWRTIPEAPWQALEMMRCTFVHGNSICVRRSLFDRVGGFDVTLRAGQDFDMWLRLLADTPTVYIPEFTCVTRCHPGQGTHGFPEACFYDSARACLHLLNERRLDNLIPGVDLASEPGLAVELARRAAEIAGEESVFAYKLGVHAALIGRLLEWVLVNAPATVRGEARRVVRAVADRTARQHPGDWLGLYWRAAQACLGQNGAGYRYRPVDWTAVAVRARDYAHARNLPDAVPLQRYLDQAGCGSSPGRLSPADARLGSAVVVVAPGTDVGKRVKYGALRATVELARGLGATGIPTLMVGVGNPGIVEDDGRITWVATDERGLTRGLRAMGCFDAAIGVSRADIVAWARARRYAIVQHNASLPVGVPVSWINRLGVPVVVVSEWARRRQVRNGIWPDLLHVVWNGVDTGVFHPLATSERHAHRLVYAGALFDYKGFDIALRGFEIIRGSFADAELILAGRILPWEGPRDLFRASWLDPSGCPDWAAIIRELPGVQYVGELEPAKLADVFRSASLLVGPSRIEETFGLASVEAQVCGCIPVLPRAGGFPETMEEGRTGFLYAPNTPEALATAILALWQRQEPTAAMRHEAVQRVRDRFGWDATVGGVLDVVNSAPLAGLSHRAAGLAARLGTEVVLSRPMRVWRWRMERLRVGLAGGGRPCHDHLDNRSECWVWGTWRRVWPGMQRTAEALLHDCKRAGQDVFWYGADLVAMAGSEQQRNTWAVRFLYLHLRQYGLCFRPPDGVLSGYTVQEARADRLHLYFWASDEIVPFASEWSGACCKVKP